MTLERLLNLRKLHEHAHKRVTQIDRQINKLVLRKLRKEIRAKALGPSNNKPDLFAGANS